MGSGASAKAKYDTPDVQAPAPPAVGFGFTTTLPYGSQPGQTVQVNAPDGRVVQVVVPRNHVSGQPVHVSDTARQNVARSSASRTQEEDIIDFIRVLEKDADAARVLAQKNLANELQLQKALWASAETSSSDRVSVLDQLTGEQGDEQPEHFQALVVAAAMEGDAAQLLVALEEAKRVSDVSTSLVAAAKELRTAEEGLLTWRCLREALQARDRPEIQAWLEQAVNMGFDAPEGVHEYMDALYKKEHAHLQNLERRREAERRLKFAQEAGEPELLAQMEAEAAALGIHVRPTNQSPRASSRQRSSAKQATKAQVTSDTEHKHEEQQKAREQKGSKDQGQEKKQEHEQRQEQQQNSRQQEQKEGTRERPRVTVKGVKAKVRVEPGRQREEPGDQRETDTRSIKELIDDCRRRGLDTATCTTREDLLNLLWRSREAENAASSSSGRPEATRKAATRPPAVPLPASVWDRQKIPAQHQVHKQYESLYLLGFDITKLKGMPTAAELRSAYRKAAMESHPDKVQNHDRQTEAKELFQRVRAAFDYLSELT